MEKQTLISQAEYARRRGCVPSYISKLVKEGIVQLISGKIDPVLADKEIADYSAQLHDPGPKGTNEGGDDSLASWRKRELQAKTALRQIELDEVSGKLINAEELKTGLAQLFTDVKTILRAIPTKTAQELYLTAKNGTSDRQAMASIATLLLREIDEALTELSRWQPKSNKDKEVKGFKKGKGHRARNK